METVEYKGYTIKIEPDMWPINPIAEWDGNPKYALFHNKYRLQNDTDLDTRDYNSWEELKEALMKRYKPIVILPVYMYDHSGITISTEPFSCPWDSGQIGFVFVDRSTLKEWGVSLSKTPVADRANYYAGLEKDIKANVRLYDQYLSGECYRACIMEDDEEIDFQGGYYGYDHEESGLLPDARSMIDSYTRAKPENQIDTYFK